MEGCGRFHHSERLSSLCFHASQKGTHTGDGLCLLSELPQWIRKGDKHVVLVGASQTNLPGALVLRACQTGRRANVMHKVAFGPF